ncbi:hypothetical protein N8D56_23815 [Devosia sp. A8/3-2]|nr:hypothetical protein N8D56_23815 [Devosia sp. A8/3-2]
MVNPLPLDRADIDTDFLIGIDVNGDPSEGIAKTDHKPLDIWFGSAQIMMHSLTAHMMAAYPPDIYIRPHVTNFARWNSGASTKSSPMPSPKKSASSACWTPRSKPISKAKCR